MKKFAISLLALAAVSTAALAGEGRNHDLRDSDTYFGKYSNQLKNESTSANAFAVTNKDTGALTAFERVKKNQEKNENGGH
ncbi:MAG: hypothetical protein Q8L53_00145 [Aestuariivirga sp.]|nr:hypothetical protein [Aestuariivirga sp.]